MTVVSSKPLVMRSGHATSSEIIGEVPIGTRLDMVELREGDHKGAQRALVQWLNNDGQCEGWVTAKFKDGTQNLVEADSASAYDEPPADDYSRFVNPPSSSTKQDAFNREIAVLAAEAAFTSMDSMQTAKAIATDTGLDLQHRSLKLAAEHEVAEKAAREAVQASLQIEIAKVDQEMAEEAVNTQAPAAARAGVKLSPWRKAKVKAMSVVAVRESVDRKASDARAAADKALQAAAEWMGSLEGEDSSTATAKQNHRVPSSRSPRAAEEAASKQSSAFAEDSGAAKARPYQKAKPKSINRPTTSLGTPASAAKPVSSPSARTSLATTSASMLLSTPPSTKAAVGRSTSTTKLVTPPSAQTIVSKPSSSAKKPSPAGATLGAKVVEVQPSQAELMVPGGRVSPMHAASANVMKLASCKTSLVTRLEVRMPSATVEVASMEHTPAADARRTSTESSESTTSVMLPSEYALPDTPLALPMEYSVEPSAASKPASSSTATILEPMSAELSPGSETLSSTSGKAQEETSPNPKAPCEKAEEETPNVKLAEATRLGPSDQPAAKVVTTAETADTTKAEYRTEPEAEVSDELAETTQVEPKLLEATKVETAVEPPEIVNAKLRVRPSEAMEVEAALDVEVAEAMRAEASVEPAEAIEAASSVRPTKADPNVESNGVVEDEEAEEAEEAELKLAEATALQLSVKAAGAAKAVPPSGELAEAVEAAESVESAEATKVQPTVEAAEAIKVEATPGVEAAEAMDAEPSAEAAEAMDAEPSVEPFEATKATASVKSAQSIDMEARDELAEATQEEPSDKPAETTKAEESVEPVEATEVMPSTEQVEATKAEWSAKPVEETEVRDAAQRPPVEAAKHVEELKVMGAIVQSAKAKDASFVQLADTSEPTFNVQSDEATKVELSIDAFDPVEPHTELGACTSEAELSVEAEGPKAVDETRMEPGPKLVEEVSQVQVQPSLSLEAVQIEPSMSQKLDDAKPSTPEIELPAVEAATSSRERSRFKSNSSADDKPVEDTAASPRLDPAIELDLNQADASALLQRTAVGVEAVSSPDAMLTCAMDSKGPGPLPPVEADVGDETSAAQALTEAEAPIDDSADQNGSFVPEEEEEAERQPGSPATQEDHLMSAKAQGQQIRAMALKGLSPGLVLATSPKMGAGELREALPDEHALPDTPPALSMECGVEPSAASKPASSSTAKILEPVSAELSPGSEAVQEEQASSTSGKAQEETSPNPNAPSAIEEQPQSALTTPAATTNECFGEAPKHPEHLVPDKQIVPVAPRNMRDERTDQGADRGSGVETPVRSSGGRRLTKSRPFWEISAAKKEASTPLAVAPIVAPAESTAEETEAARAARGNQADVEQQTGPRAQQSLGKAFDDVALANQSSTDREGLALDVLASESSPSGNAIQHETQATASVESQFSLPHRLLPKAPDRLAQAADTPDSYQLVLNKIASIEQRLESPASLRSDAAAVSTTMDEAVRLDNVTLVNHEDANAVVLAKLAKIEERLTAMESKKTAGGGGCCAIS